MIYSIIYSYVIFSLKYFDLISYLFDVTHILFTDFG